MIDSIIILFIVIAAGAAGILLYRYFSRFFRNLAMRRQFRRGAEGEREAEKYLKRHGYRIVESQAKRRMYLSVDGKQIPFEIRADFIAKKRSQKCLVEVKTGSQAADPAYPDTRRQLIEYAVSFNVDRICLFDANKGALHEIGLPVRPGDMSSARRLFYFGVGCGAGLTAIVAWIIQHGMS